MVRVMSLYLDESGTRNPDRNPSDTLPCHGYDWFGIGGVIVRDEERATVEASHQAFCTTWNITYPLHSCEIRAKSDHFKWLGALPKDQLTSFYGDLTRLVTTKPLVAIACVIDRPGYNARYRQQYGRQRWALCKTAFNVVVERAAKYARRHDHRLRVFVERADKKTDNQMQQYYEELRCKGQPFNPNTSAKYSPLCADRLKETLYDFKTKDKASKLIQLADLSLWPICIGGYDNSNRSYRDMRDAQMLIDCLLPSEAVAQEGVKYSCWEVQATKSGETKTRKPG